ncbi:hypothetical protein KAM472_36240 [Aeromonas caviae]|nr:hypothetical protein KAM472_36240 [Aeromonas caviae]
MRCCIICAISQPKKGHAPPYYPHHDTVNGIDCALYAILFDAAYPDAEQAHE